MGRKLLTFFIVTTLSSGFFISQVNAYGVPTHAFLTKRIVEFYDKYFPNKKIPQDFVSYVIDGARLEDNAPRYMNHFYDPVYHRGLADGVYRGIASKIWAQDEKAQNALLYKIFPQTEASLLTATQIQKISDSFYKTDFTWQKAIDLYAKGETEESLFALGHILHLIEDASVPDHTRNDAHPPFDDGGSPYENWTGKFNLENPDQGLLARLADKKPILLEKLDDYFEGIATYSNNNFYSKDSIKSYRLPQPDYFKKIGDYSYGFKIDKDMGDYRLFVTEEKSIFEEAGNTIANAKIFINKVGGDLVISDYWSRLSTKAVQYGAGVVNLFFKEAEAAREKYLTAKAQRPFLATLIDGMKSIFGGGESKDIADTVNEFKLVGEVPIEKKETGNKKQVTSIEQEKSQPLPLSESPVEETKSKIEQTAAQPVPAVSPAPDIADAKQEAKTETIQQPACSFSTSQTPSHQGVIINEVAWMGTNISSGNEWIELKNVAIEEIDLSGWQVVDKGEKIKLTLNGKLSAGGLYLLERTDDSTVPGVTADQIYVGALSNSDEGLRLFDKNCNLVDEILANPDWPAGATDPRRTAERSSDLSWHSSSVDGGTPKQENSSAPQPVYNSSSGSNNTSKPTTNQKPPAPKVLISEILFDAEGSDSNKEFIELYNPTDQVVDLSSWSIQNLSGSGSLMKKNFETGNQIAPKSFFLIWLGDDSRADLKWLSGSLNNTAATIYLVNNTNLISTTSPSAVDSVSYDVANLNGFVAGNSIERKAFSNGACVSAQNSGEYLGNGCDTDSPSDFEVRPMPNPQNKQSLPEPRSSPTAVTNFQISYSSSTAELFFNWDLSANADKYHLIDVTSATSTFSATTSANSSKMSVSETGRNYKFNIYAVDKDGLYSSPGEGTIFVPASPPPPPPQPTPAGISNVLFGHDSIGNYISFTLNDTTRTNDSAAIHYVLVWLNSDPKEITVANRGSGIAPNWAGGGCPSSGIVADNGGNESAGGTGFDNYVMPDYQPANNNPKPPVYDPTKTYNYKVYFSDSCPNSGFSDGKDLKGQLTSEDFVTLGLWVYHTNFGTIDGVKSINYPDKHYFQP